MQGELKSRAQKNCVSENILLHIPEAIKEVCDVALKKREYIYSDIIHFHFIYNFNIR